MEETIMGYAPYKLWNDDLPEGPLPKESFNGMTTVDLSPWAIRGSDDIGATVSKELIDSITKEVVEQIKDDYNEVKTVREIREKYHLKHR